ncbi:TonB-dependent receptor [Pelomonas sp. UHG3]|uniref:TonB-dependent receptor n=1 Tax=Roseateles hydrophilus TaxID=2975054 RepID=A0ACC6C8C9_9BURK|nr:TonB-dependent receptor [Pelomonas sp. UHG3]MCY4744662.1 TonB-dependent receptor [Pelomonas sp. UHG3]
MTSTPLLRRDRIGTAVSFALALMAHEAVMAQTPAAPAAAASAPATAAKPAEAPKAKAPVNELETVLVVGTRQSQQSAINRKKTAATVQDSIVAEDVGAFPDRNIGEAISRIAGVALDRGDYGEGVNVTIRGNGPESTRVEMDGVGVSSGAGTNLLGGGDGRGTEFRELSSDLIKSVDIVKGATASMTQGSLGASVIIETRNGLDFDKPYYSFRLAASKSDLAKKTTPDANLIWTDKFFNKKLGVMVNLNRARTVRENHQISQGGSNAQQGLVRLADFDNSPEKTFSYANSVNALLPSAADVPVSQWATTGGGVFASLTPRQILETSAAAATKADCLTKFPLYTTAQLAPITTSANRTLAYQSRVNEQVTCLNQWNDYTLSHSVGPRYNFRSNDDTRTSGDIRLDYKVNDQLSVYGKFISNRRHVDDIVGFLSMGGAPIVNGAGTFTDNVVAGTRTLATGAVGSTLPGTYSFRANNAPMILGATTNLLPGYTVDSTHHVTSYSTDGNFLGTDTILSSIDTTNKTLQGGGEYRNDRLRAKFMGSFNKGTGLRYDRRASFSTLYGVGNFNLEPNGLWSFTRPGGAAIDQMGNLAGYATLNPAVQSAAVPVDNFNPLFVPAYAAAQRAQYTNNTQLNVIRAFDNENTEKQLKLDLTYNTVDKLPFLTALKTGVQLIDYSATTWGGGGGELASPVGTAGQAGFKPGVYAPSVTGRWNVIGCENTAGSLATGGQPCAYGTVRNPRYDAGVGATVGGTTTLTTAQFQELVRQTLTITPNGQYYGGAKDRPATLLNGWNQIDIDRLFQLAGFNVPLNCFRTCTASDGKVYDMPKSGLKDKQTAGYLQTDFEIDRLPFTDHALPFGLELAGNVGVRVVRTDMESTGFMIFRSIRKNPQWVEGNGDTTNVTTAQVSQNVDFKGSRTDVSPSFNLALWPIPDKLVTRFSWAKQIARLPMSRVAPIADGTVTCTVSEIVEDRPLEDDGTAADQGCNRVFGNPAMKPQTTISKNLSLEWYVNRETSLSVSAFEQRDLVGAPNLRVGYSDVNLFAGSKLLDPLSGTPLSDLEFSFSQWNNMTPSKRRGLEFSAKTAFTFLPSVLRYTGFDANYSRLRNSAGSPMIDQISGEALPLIGQPKYSYNAALWYDDGALQFRVAQQVVASKYAGFSPNSNTSGLAVNNFPGELMSAVRFPYNPGAPMFNKRTAFIDAKVSYRFKSGIELFADVRNLTGERNQTSTGGYQNYAGGIASIYSDAYYGRTYMVGMTYRSPR